MVQVQSTWFPLYDRNPQTFVGNVLTAKPTDYRKATQRVYRSASASAPASAARAPTATASADGGTFVELPIVRPAPR